MRPTIAICALASAATIAGAAGAAELNIIAQNRQAVTGAVVINTTTGQIDNDELLSEPFGPGPWQTSIESIAQLDGTIAIAGALQDSLIGPTALGGTGTVVTALTTTGPETTSQGFALSAFAAFFSVGSPTLVSFSASISDTASSFMIFEGPDGVIAMLGNGAGPDLGVDLTVLLAPGNYALNASSLLDNTLAEGMPALGITASWSLDLTIVPAPAAPALALCAMFGCTRRRR